MPVDQTYIKESKTVGLEGLWAGGVQQPQPQGPPGAQALGGGSGSISPHALHESHWRALHWREGPPGRGRFSEKHF